MGNEGITSVDPLILFYLPEKYDQCASNLRRGLNSMNKEEVHQSISGIHHWLLYSSINTNLPKPSDDLFEEIINMVLSRRQPGLDTSLNYLADIIRKFPGLLNQSHIDKILIALDYLINYSSRNNSHYKG